MKQSRLVALAAAALSVTTMTANAADGDGQFAVRGIGGQTFSTYAKAATEGDPQLAGRFVNWFMGYVTAANRLSEGTYDTLVSFSDREIMGLLLGVCRANDGQDVLFESIASQTLRLTSPFSAAENSDAVLITSGENGSLRLRKATVVWVQQQLIDQGYLEGRADGAFGPNSQAALKQFQQQSDIPATGLPTVRSMLRLASVGGE